MTDIPAPDQERSQVVALAPDELCAEVIKSYLLQHGIRAVICAPDPANLGMVVGAVLVLSTHYARAARLLAETRACQHAEEWTCPSCSEPNPGTFDLCWNCGTLHSEPQESPTLVEVVAPEPSPDPVPVV